MKSIYETTGYSCSNVRYSSHIANLFACSASQCYGLTGSGALFVLDHFAEDIANPIKCYKKFFYKKDRLIDVAWLTESVLITSAADGCYQVWNLNNYLDCSDPLSDYELSPDPIRTVKAHNKEINSIDIRHNQLITCSSDKCIKLFDCKTSQQLANYTLNCDSRQAVFSPHRIGAAISGCFAVGSLDGQVRVFNPSESLNPVISLTAGNCHQVNCIDWSPVNCNLIIAGLNSGAIIGFDIRSSNQPLFVINGHHFKPIKKIRFNPHKDWTFASVSADHSTKIFTLSPAINNTINAAADQPIRSQLIDCDPIHSYKHHSASVSGVDYNQIIRDELIDCGRDSMIHLYAV